MAKFDQQAFSKRLASLRNLRSWSQADLARESGLTRATISGLEVGNNGPSLKTAIELADALGVSLDVLAGLAPMPGDAA